MKKLQSLILRQERPRKQLILLSVDIVLLFLAIMAAFSMRLGTWYWPQGDIVLLFIAAPIIAIPVFIRLGLYRAIIRYIGFRAIWTIIQAVSLYALIWGVLVLLSGIQGVPRSVILINWLMSIILIGGSRMIARWWFQSNIEITDLITNGRKNVVIYGAGTAGVQLATALSYSPELKPVAYIDDDFTLIGQHVNGLRVHPFIHLERLIERKSVKEVLLAIPSASRRRRNEIITLLEPYAVHVRTLPGVSDIAQGKVKIEDIREVDIDDILGRDAVAPDVDLLDACIRGKTVMVTGAGGSIGSELCRQILLLRPEKLILFEQSEFALFAIERDLRKQILKGEIKPDLIALLGSVQNRRHLEKIMKTYGVQTVYHAAAYKHVPLVEHNMAEGVRNNVFGTRAAAEAAMSSGVETFVLISTDKAVRPTNVMGASKRLAELVLQGLSQESDVSTKTRFCMVRFGNVLGSSGSVVPLFREQIRNGGPVTVTHPDIIRYFMTIPEAAQLVIQAGSMGKGGDVFVLDMGEPVKIAELAKKMIRLMGLSIKNEENPDGDIEIKYTGLRPGEKLFEELLIGNNVTGTKHPRILRAEEVALPWDKVHEYLDLLEEAIDEDDCSRIRDLFLQAVNGYVPQGDIVDCVWLKRERAAGTKPQTVGNNHHQKEAVNVISLERKKET